MLNISARGIFVSPSGNHLSVVGILDGLLVSGSRGMAVSKGTKGGVWLDATKSSPI